QIARRPELPAAASFLAALIMLQVTGEDWVGRAGRLMTGASSYIGATSPLTPELAHWMLLKASIDLAWLTLPVIVAAIAASLAGNFAQGGFVLTPSLLAPSGDKFNPASNIKKIFSIDKLVDLTKECLLLAGLGLVCYGAFISAVEHAATLVGSPAAQTLKVCGELIYRLGIRAGSVLLFMAAIDYGYGWYKHEKSLKMTKQEIRDEYKQQEGDPMIKSQRRRAARALAQRQISVEVPRADVVVTNPTHFAVALRYDRTEHPAPMVVAKGADLMAKQIRHLAKINDVPVIENPPLARALYKKVEVQGLIPPELFSAVAELLAYVYRQRHKSI
ncbi:MAG TPA: EscU/YscU/HrcU family type III secretion system export apparatus switch protein, partial [Blastocatellia bacterium]|nr:EscU/YscU/HrcU family type III secretion system export apparatus switch protein [Blastocatellia bacterium]